MLYKIVQNEIIPERFWNHQYSILASYSTKAFAQ